LERITVDMLLNVGKHTINSKTSFPTAEIVGL
jgi:hypothetical protein